MRTIFLITFILSLISCSSDDKKADDNSINGTWKLIEVYGSDGTGGSWSTINDGYTYTLNIDSTISSSNYNCVGEYLIDQELEYNLFINFNCQSVEFSGNYKFGFENKQLILYSNPSNCDEGCAEKFKRIIDE